jgi:hypothetical protein
VGEEAAAAALRMERIDTAIWALFPI